MISILLLTLTMAGCYNPFRKGPAMIVEPTALFFGSKTTKKTFFIHNPGSSGLKWEIEADVPWLVVDPLTGKDGQEIDVTIKRDGLPAAEYEGDIRINGNYRSIVVKVFMEVLD